MRFLAPLIVAVVAALPAAARPLSEAEAGGLAHAIDSYVRATTGNDAEGIVATIPPRILNIFAGASGIEASKVKETLVGQTRDLMKGARITDFTVSPGPYDAADATLADGTAVVWVVVPAEFTTDVKGKKTLNHQPLFAVREDGEWYFSRVDGPQQQQMVGMAYPFVAAVKLPAATATPVP
ncbi:MAG: hypothetical protein JSR87_02135 [Proteobacteria bacterium]|nr:hypothetical protein [Pseudomonadota bacterium]MBS0573104.1 hypothetical protein [Pseudomonadota bacterium]